MKKWKSILLVQILAMVFCTFAYAGNKEAKEPKNYCDDIQAWAEWKDLINKYPEDDNLRAAYALRLGLCQEVKEHTIKTERAIIIFDRFMDALKWQTAEVERMQNKSKDMGI